MYHAFQWIRGLVLDSLHSLYYTILLPPISLKLFPSHSVNQHPSSSSRQENDKETPGYRICSSHTIDRFPNAKVEQGYNLETALRQCAELKQLACEKSDLILKLNTGMNSAGDQNQDPEPNAK